MNPLHINDLKGKHIDLNVSSKTFRKSNRSVVIAYRCLPTYCICPFQDQFAIELTTFVRLLTPPTKHTNAALTTLANTFKSASWYFMAIIKKCDIAEYVPTFYWSLNGINFHLDMYKQRHSFLYTYYFNIVIKNVLQAGNQGPQYVILFFTIVQQNKRLHVCIIRFMPNNKYTCP